MAQNMCNWSPWTKKRKKEGAEKIFEEKIAQYFLNLMKIINPQISETQTVSTRNTKKTTPRLLLIKYCSSNPVTEKTLQVSKGKKDKSKGTKIKITDFFVVGNHASKETMGKHYRILKRKTVKLAMKNKNIILFQT